MYYSNYTEQEENDISKQLKDLSYESAIKDYEKFRLAVQTNIDSIKPLSPIGSKFIDFFIHIEILKTRNKHNISFYDFWYNREFYMNRDPSTIKLINSIKTNKPHLTDVKIGKQVYNLYYGSISIFRPTIAAKLYSQFKPICILDPTMGWSGRLIGASALNIPKYIGIDSNMRLEKSYEEIKKYLNTVSTTEIELYFKDCLTIDYSTMDYDMVFTSPPYYSTEIYGEKIVYKTKDDWNKNFYIPLIEKTWKHLKIGGHFCLNVPVCIYDNVCVLLLGECNEKIELKKYQRILPKKEDVKIKNVGQKYGEFIYIWIRN
jgi:hypothetical protein